MDIAQNLMRVREQIAQAAAKAGSVADEVALVAITKTHPADKVREAIEAGHNLFGESRVQEARAKIPELPSNLRWHFVGHLQKNKIRHALPLFEMIHSVDSLGLAQEINRIAEEEGMHPRVLLEVNVAGEGSKFGFSPEKLRDQMEALLALPRLSILGLMTIPPLAEEAEASRKYFVRLRELRDRLQTDFRVDLAQLSMGMTQDFSVAVEEGATLVRVGTNASTERGGYSFRNSFRARYHVKLGVCASSLLTSNKLVTNWRLPGTMVLNRFSNSKRCDAHAHARHAAANPTCLAMSRGHT